jgi:hypothetical protein
MSGIPSWAVRGAKVVCVDGGTPTCEGMELIGWVPVTGDTYTLSRVWCRRDGRVLCELKEQPRTSAAGGWGLVGHFCPLITQQDDIEAHFKALLDVPEQVGA